MTNKIDPKINRDTNKVGSQTKMPSVTAKTKAKTIMKQYITRRTSQIKKSNLLLRVEKLAEKKLLRLQRLNKAINLVTVILTVLSALYFVAYFFENFIFTNANRAILGSVTIALTVTYSIISLVYFVQLIPKLVEIISLKKKINMVIRSMQKGEDFNVSALKQIIERFQSLNVNTFKMPSRSNRYESKSLISGDPMVSAMLMKEALNKATKDTTLNIIATFLAIVGGIVFFIAPHISIIISIISLIFTIVALIIRHMMHEKPLMYLLLHIPVLGQFIVNKLEKKDEVPI